MAYGSVDEMVFLMMASPNGIVVEIQRNEGCSIDICRVQTVGYLVVWTLYAECLWVTTYHSCKFDDLLSPKVVETEVWGYIVLRDISVPGEHFRCV